MASFRDRTAIAIVAVALSTTVNSYTPAPFLPRTTRSSHLLQTSFHTQRKSTLPFQRHVSQHTPLKMLVEPSGKDGLNEILNQPSAGGQSSKNIITSTLQKTPPKLRKLTSFATLPLSALAGFVWTPSRRIAAHVVGGTLTLALGSITKNRLDDITSEVAKPAMAELLLQEGLEDPTSTAEKVEQIGKDYSVNAEDFIQMKIDVYAAYLIGACKNPMCKTSDIQELKNLRSILSLSNLEVGEAHSYGGSELFRRLCLFTPEEELRDDPEHPDRMSIDKFLFLSERAFRSFEDTEEAYNFEFERVARQFKTTVFEATERTKEVAEPFYKRALVSARNKMESGVVSGEMLSRARVTLGIDEAQMRDLHTEAYAEEVHGMFEDGEQRFSEEGLERLTALQELLTINDEDAEYERGVEATPLFQATVVEVLDSAIEGTGTDSAAAWKTIADRMGELALGESSTQPLVDSIVVQKLGVPLESAIEFAKVNNDESANEKLLEAINIQSSVFPILESAGTKTMEELNTRYLDPTSASSGNGFLSPDDRKKLYNSFVQYRLLQQTSEDGVSMTTDNEELSKQVATYLGMTEFDVQDTSRQVCGPILEKELKTAAFEITGEDVTDALLTNLKKKVEDVVRKYSVPAELVREYGMNVYRDTLKVVSLKCPSGIPSTTQATSLNNLLELLNLEKEDVNTLHMQTFGQSYKKSILESMGSTGVILEEYREALSTLQERLGLVKDEDVQKLFLQAVADKLKPMVQLLANELERTMMTQEQLAQRRGKDMGSDYFQGGAPKGKLGLGSDGNLMGDIMNVIQFYKENDISQQTKVGTTEPSTEDPDAETVPIYETTYPVTALSVNAIDSEMAIALYRQFLVGGFSVGDAALASKYESEASTFGGVLGLTNEQMDAIASDIGGMIYENYITNAFKTKDSLDQNDMMFLANIQTKLNFKEDESADLMLKAQKKVLLAEANGIMSEYGGFPPEQSKRFREKCNALGMDLSADVGLPADRIEAMFAIEMLAGIDSGALTTESASEITELQDSLNMETEKCEQKLDSLVVGKCASIFESMVRELMRGREDSCVEPIKTLLKFAVFVNGEFGDAEERKAKGLPVIEKDMANKIVGVYQASIGGKDNEEEQQLLKNTLGLN